MATSAVMAVVTLRFRAALQAPWIEVGRHRITGRMKPVFLILVEGASRICFQSVSEMWPQGQSWGNG